MSSRQIGIQITEEGLVAVQAVKAEGAYRLERAVRLPMQRNTDTLKGCLNRLTEERGFDHRAGVSVALPYRESIYIRSGLEGAEAKESACLEIASDDLPVLESGAVASSQKYFNPEHQRMETLITAAPADAVEKRLEEMQGAKMRCECMDTAGAAMIAAVQVKHAEIDAELFMAVYADESHILITIAKEGNLFCVRNIPNPDVDTGSEEEAGQRNRFLLREMELTWRSVLSERMAENTPVVLMGGIGRQSGLTELIRNQLGARVIVYEVEMEEKGGEPGDGYCVAAGMAIRGLNGADGGGMNFVRLVKQKSRQNAENRNGLRMPAILLVSVVILLGLGIGVRSIRLEREYAAMNREIRQTFERILPDEKNIVDEAAQLDQRVKDAEAALEKVGPWQANATDAVTALQSIIECMPIGVTVSLDSISVGAEEVRILARGETAEALDAWQERLKETGMFSGVNVRHVQKSAGGVQCEMILTVKEN